MTPENRATSLVDRAKPTGADLDAHTDMHPYNDPDLSLYVRKVVATSPSARRLVVSHGHTYVASSGIFRQELAFPVNPELGRAYRSRAEAELRSPLRGPDRDPLLWDWPTFLPPSVRPPGGVPAEGPTFTDPPPLVTETPHP